MQARSLNLVALAALTLAAATAHAAAPTAELKVKGTIDVPTCTVTAAKSGVYDFGGIGNTLIKSGTTHTALNPISQDWTVTCDADTFLTFSVVDNRATSVSTVATNNFGLGTVNTTGKIGYYTVNLTSPTVDSVASSTFATTGTTISSAASTNLYAGGNKMGWSSGPALKSGKVFGASLAVTPNIGGTTTMGGAITDEVDLDGSLTLTYAFGL